MKINRKSIAAGLTVGVLAGGAGGAIAASTSGSMIASPSSTTSRATGGWDRYGSGWGGAAAGWGGAAAGWDRRGTGWRDPASGSDWGSDTNGGGMRWTSLARSGRQAAQTYLGLTASQLRSGLQSGKTLGGIASGQGKSVAGLESAIESAVTDSVNADSALSASPKSSIIANLRSFVVSVVTDAGDGAAGPWHGGPYAATARADW
jgi:hypothetical protein